MKTQKLHYQVPVLNVNKIVETTEGAPTYTVKSTQGYFSASLNFAENINFWERVKRFFA